ncbi:MAG: hypothetical protein ACU0BF_11865, partial [Paracoccaceae bacterium]
PIEGRPLIPAHATTTPPPETGAHEAAVWDGAAWSVVADHRGAVYWTADGARHRIDALGETPPDDALDAPPPPPVAEQLADALGRVEAMHEAALVAATGGATVAARDTWPAKEAAARALLDGAASGSQADMLAAEATARGETAGELATYVLAKADAFRALVGVLGAARAAARGNLRAAAEAHADDPAAMAEEAVAVTDDMARAIAGLASPAVAARAGAESAEGAG